METIFGQNPEVSEVKMGFSLRVSHFHAQDPPAKVLSHRVEHELA